MAHSGPLTPQQTLRAAVLWAGKGAALADLTAARLQGFRGCDEKANSIHLLISAVTHHTKRSTQPPFPVAAQIRQALREAGDAC